MSNLPEHIRIGGIDYAVSEVKDLRDGNAFLNGHIIFDDCEIKVNSDIAPLMQWIVVWHEALHGILYHAGIDDEESEAMIRALSYGIAQVLRDNPWLREK